MTELSRRYPNALMGTVALARQALYDAHRYRDEWAAYEKAPAGKKRPALRRRARGLAGRGGGQGDAGRHRLRAPTTSAAPWPWPTSSRSRSRWRGRPRPRASPSLVKERKLPLLVSVNFDPPRAAAFFGGQDDEQEKARHRRGREEPGRARTRRG